MTVRIFYGRLSDITAVHHRVRTSENGCWPVSAIKGVWALGGEWYNIRCVPKKKVLSNWESAFFVCGLEILRRIETTAFFVGKVWVLKTFSWHCAHILGRLVDCRQFCTWYICKTLFDSFLINKNIKAFMVTFRNVFFTKNLENSRGGQRYKIIWTIFGQIPPGPLQI